ncbi:MAG: hypothetical protein ACI4II_03990 [Acutalibacteraceae bacterium]
MKRTAKISVLLAILTTAFMIFSMQDDISKAQFCGQLTCVFSIITMFVAFASWNTSGKQKKIEDMIEIVDDEQQKATTVESDGSDIGEKEDQILLGDQSENKVNSCSSSDDCEPEINDEAPSETDKTVSNDNDFNDGPIIVDEEDDEM